MARLSTQVTNNRRNKISFFYTFLITLLYIPGSQLRHERLPRVRDELQNIRFMRVCLVAMKSIQEAFNARFIWNRRAKVEKHQDLAAQAIHPLNAGFMRSAGHLAKDGHLEGKRLL